MVMYHVPLCGVWPWGWFDGWALAYTRGEYILQSWLLALTLALRQC